MELSKTKLTLFSSLTTAKMRRRHGLFIAEGAKCVCDMLRTFEPVAIVVEKGADLCLKEYSCETYYATHEQMRKLSNLSTSSDVVGVFKLPNENKTIEPPEVCDSLYLVLDGVRDPGNMGTIIRTCHWFGIFRIFASYDSADVFNPKTIQAAMGSVGRVEVTYCDLPALFDTNPSLPVYGTLLEGENVFDAKLESKGFIVMGNEGKGISAEVRSKISKPLFIPPSTSDHGESLNVAIATSVIITRFIAACRC